MTSTPSQDYTVDIDVDRLPRTVRRLIAERQKRTFWLRALSAFWTVALAAFLVWLYGQVVTTNEQVNEQRREAVRSIETVRVNATQQIRALANEDSLTASKLARLQARSEDTKQQVERLRASLHSSDSAFGLFQVMTDSELTAIQSRADQEATDLALARVELANLKHDMDVRLDREESAFRANRVVLRDKIEAIEQTLNNAQVSFSQIHETSIDLAVAIKRLDLNLATKVDTEDFKALTARIDTLIRRSRSQ